MFGFTDDGERQYSVHRCTPSRFCNCHPMERWSHRWVRNCGAWPDGASRRPRNVETVVSPKVNVLRGLAARATTPLLPDDYLKLLNPLWSARELRGEVVDVRPETEGLRHGQIKPGWGFSGDYRPGQYVGIGLRVDGRWHWRSYSLTSVPRRDKKLHHDHRQGDARGFPVHAPGQRCQARHDRPACRRPRGTSRCRIRHLRRSCS